MFLSGDFLLLALLLPLLGILFFAVIPSGKKSLATCAVAFAWLYAAVTIASVLLAFRMGSLELQGPVLRLGISGFEVTLRFFLDGRKALFLLLLGLCPAIVFTLLRDRASCYGKSYYVSALALVFSLAVVFTSDSLLLFYFFWEAALIAVYFWIGLYGRANPKRSVYPVLLRFALFTLAGSLPMLISLAAICASGFRDPGLRGLPEAVAQLSPTTRSWVFGGFLLAFAVKLPLFGFHGWLRDTYNVAPPACRALLSAVMSKMGAFGLILILAPAFPAELQRFSPWLLTLAVSGVVYGALLMMAQERFIDMLAYASLSHLSLLALGVFASARAGDAASTALSGALLLAFNHGIIMTMLFSLDARILVGGASPDMRFVGGLRNHQRRLSAFLLLSIFAGAGLPGLSNFVGEILIYFTAFRASPWLVLWAGFGTLIGAAALVRYYHAVFLGGPSAENPAAAPDLGAGETAVSLGVAALWLVLGLYPMLLLHPVEKALLFLNSVIL